MIFRIANQSFAVNFLSMFSSGFCSSLNVSAQCMLSRTLESLYLRASGCLLAHRNRFVRPICPMSWVSADMIDPKTSKSVMFGYIGVYCSRKRVEFITSAACVELWYGLS
jgi:hypothetical protein